MKRQRVAIALCMVWIGTFGGFANAADPPAAGAPPAAENAAALLPADATSAADPAILAEVTRLVEASLEALRDGRDFRHQAFLKESLEKLPDFAPARWQSGFVRLDGAWVHVDQVPSLAANNPVLETYARLREQADAKRFPKATTAQTNQTRLVGLTRTDRLIRTPSNSGPQGSVTTSTPAAATATPGTTKRWRREHGTFVEENLRLINTAGYSPGYARAQATLARWCAQHGLVEEARVHWRQVLKEEPRNREAAVAQGLVELAGRFVSKEQFANAKERQRDIERSLQTWQERLTRLERDATARDADRRSAVLAELRAMDDPDAVYALELVALWRSPLKERQSDVMEAFDRTAVEVIAKSDAQTATESLTRFAVLHPADRVRQDAAERLAKRDMNAFVPILLSALTLPIQYGVTVVENELGQKQIRAGAVQEHEDHFAGVREARHVYDDWQLRFLTTAALAQMQQIEQFNLQTDELNRRIAAALGRCVRIDAKGPYRDLVVVTEYDTPNPKRWWEWWYDYNEQYVSGDKPYYGYDYGCNMYDGPDYVYEVPQQRMSCFAKGTPVWTLSGAKPVEELKVGDRVLSQNAMTGELAYKGVVATTIRPPSKMLIIRTGKSSITTTLGHPFFVVGKGWRMAKQLRSDDWVCTQGDAAPIDGVEDAAPVEAYNLVVADFGTYFVGKDRVLVHDNSPIPPARLEMPGLLTSTR